MEKIISPTEPRKAWEGGLKIALCHNFTHTFCIFASRKKQHIMYHN